MRISQKDVAAAANVSQALVSLILSEESKRSSPRDQQKKVRVSEGTRLQVIEAAERLGYLPRANPRPSALGQDKTLVYIRPPARRTDAGNDSWMAQVEEDGHQAIQNSLIEAACNQGFTLKVRICEQADDMPQLLQSEEVDGVFLGVCSREVAGKIQTKCPVISLCGKSLPFGDAVMVDQEEVISQAVEYLQKCGHQDIALLAACPGDHTLASRIFAFKECEGTFGIQASEEFLNCRSPGEFVEKFQAGNLPGGRPTAIIAEEALALRIIRDLGGVGLSVPEDLSVVGIGNSAAAAFSSPPLTSVDLRYSEIGRAAVNQMIERLKIRSDVFLKIALSPQLQIRESVGSREFTQKQTISGNHNPKSSLK
jgi:LacI family transcriptional regulator